jgi:hypothetical protein
MCESIVVVGAALSADVDAPTERVHSAPGARRGQSAKQPTGERIGGGENDQHAITTGTIDGDKVVIAARHATNGREYRLELTLKNEELNGTVTTAEHRAELRTKRRKE